MDFPGFVPTVTDGLDGSVLTAYMEILKYIKSHPFLTQEQIEEYIKEASLDIIGEFSYANITKDKDVPIFFHANNTSVPPESLYAQGYRIDFNTDTQEITLISQWPQSGTGTKEIRTYKIPKAAPATLILEYPEDEWNNLTQQDKINLYNSGTRYIEITAISGNEDENYMVQLTETGTTHFTDRVTSVNGMTGDVTVQPEGWVAGVVSVNGSMDVAANVQNLQLSASSPKLNFYLSGDQGFGLDLTGNTVNPRLFVRNETYGLIVGAGIGSGDSAIRVDCYSSTNPPPYPVTSVNNVTGNVKLPVIIYSRTTPSTSTNEQIQLTFPEGTTTVLLCFKQLSTNDNYFIHTMQYTRGYSHSSVVTSTTEILNAYNAPVRVPVSRYVTINSTGVLTLNTAFYTRTYLDINDNIVQENIGQPNALLLQNVRVF